MSAIDVTDTVPVGSSRISFGVIVAGVVTALASQIVLMLLGGAIGFLVLPASAKGVGIGYLVWLLITLSLSSFLGAWCATSLFRGALRRDGLLYGFVIWAGLICLSAMFVGGTMSNVIRGAFGLAGQAVTAPAGAAATQAAPGLGEALRRGAAQTGQVARQPGTAEHAATGVSVGLWTLFILFIVPLGTALLGGLVGSSARERELRGRPVRERAAYPPPTTPPVPTAP
jgi:hypothetical protein